MNETLPNTIGFAKAAAGRMQFDFQTELDLAHQAPAYEVYLRGLFQKEHWPLAEYALDLLLDKTRGKFRNDLVTPEWIHSARPIELLFSLTQSGLLNRSKIEKQYGSYEIAVCGWLLHDLGENENVTRSGLAQYFFDRHGGAINDATHSKITKICNDFDLLTLQNKGKTAFDEYLHNLLDSAYGFLVKLGDRADNLATLIGLNRPEWEHMGMANDNASTPAHFYALPEDEQHETAIYFERIRRYYSHTAHTFSTNDIVGEACHRHPLLSAAYDAMDSVLGVQFVLNRAYHGYHPMNEHNAPGKSKRLSGHHLVVNISPYFEKAASAYQFTHMGANVIKMTVDRIHREAAHYPVLNFQYQTKPRDRGLRDPSSFAQLSSIFRRGLPSLTF